MEILNLRMYSSYIANSNTDSNSKLCTQSKNQLKVYKIEKKLQSSSAVQYSSPVVQSSEWIHPFIINLGLSYPCTESGMGVYKQWTGLLARNGGIVEWIVFYFVFIVYHVVRSFPIVFMPTFLLYTANVYPTRYV